MGAATMRTLVLTSRGDVEIAAAPAPRPRPGEVVVGVAACGVCGTDLREIRARRAAAAPRRSFGHELAGTVVESADDRWTPGVRVAVDPAFACGACASCRRGRSSYCRRLVVLGDGGSGGMADLVAVPGTALHVVPDDVPLSAAVLVEPLSCAHHAITRAREGARGTVLVLGAGGIGMGIALLLRARGHDDVTLVDPAPSRRRVAAAMGFATSASAADREPVELVFEASGSARGLDDAVAVAARGGELVVVSQHERTLTIAAEAAFAKELSISWSLGALPPDFEQVLELLRRKVLDPLPLVKRVTPEQLAAGALEDALTGRTAKLVVAFDVTHTPAVGSVARKSTSPRAYG